MAHPEGHLAGGGHVRVWFPAEEVDEGCGGVEGEGGGQQSVHQGRSLAQRGHRVSLAQVQGPQLQPKSGYLHISMHIYTYLHVTRIYAYLHMCLQRTATHLVMLSGVSRMCALCSSWGLAVSLDTATSSAVSPHRSMFL